jgi:predicted nucleic acid-binding protein
MTVIAGAAPVNYLILIEAIELLPKLYGQIVILESVLSELNTGRSSSGNAVGTKQTRLASS